VLQSTKQGILPVQPVNPGLRRSHTAIFTPPPPAAPVEPRTSWSLNSRGNRSGYQQEVARTASDTNLNEDAVQGNVRDYQLVS
jgi:hypothetical protein